MIRRKPLIAERLSRSRVGASERSGETSNEYPATLGRTRAAAIWYHPILNDYFIIFGATLASPNDTSSRLPKIPDHNDNSIYPESDDSERMIQKVRLSRLFIASTLLSTILCAQEVSPTKRTLSLQGLKPSPTHCQLGLKAQFLDDTTLLLSNPICAKR